MTMPALSPSDVLMANLLKLRALDVIPLFAAGDGPARHLRKALDQALLDLRDVGSFESYEDLTGLEQAVGGLGAANRAALEVKGGPQSPVPKFSTVATRTSFPSSIPGCTTFTGQSIQAKSGQPSGTTSTRTPTG